METLGNYPGLSSVCIDGFLVKEKSLGRITLDHPQISRFTVRNADKADEKIMITSNCIRLKQLELLHTDRKKLVIEAPNIERVAIDGMTGSETGDLTISAMSGYTLHINRSAVHLEDCPGVGKLIIENNWGQECEQLTARRDKANYYPLLHTIVGRSITCYSNQFFHSFGETAPALHELYLEFNDVLHLEMQPEDEDLIIKHPHVKWVTLLKGNASFRMLKISKESKRLALLKFRDFELEEFVNDLGVRFWSEKNLLQGRDFF